MRLSQPGAKRSNGVNTTLNAKAIEKAGRGFNKVDNYKNLKMQIVKSSFSFIEEEKLIMEGLNEEGEDRIETDEQVNGPNNGHDREVNDSYGVGDKCQMKEYKGKKKVQSNSASDRQNEQSEKYSQHFLAKLTRDA
ncbi:hypothetical protein MKX01_021950, partial [Papaver californicum]